MNTQERLRQLIIQETGRLRASIPPDREAVTLAVVRARDRLPLAPGRETPLDLVTGRRRADLGGNLAVRLCLESDGDDVLAGPGLTPGGVGVEVWGERFLVECGQLAEAELVLAQCEAGYIRLAEDNDGTVHAWIATKRTPPSWRERADIDWWAAWLARRHAPGHRSRELERPGSRQGDTKPGPVDRAVAGVILETMAYQLGYPEDAEIGGCTVRIYKAVLGSLIGRGLDERHREDVAMLQSERGLAAEIAVEIGVDPGTVARAMAGFTLDRAGAAYHAAVPGVAAAPLVRLGPDRLVWSVHGLTTEPLFFLTRELRRRDPEGYHNSAHLREAVFRQDLYALFGDKRFVTSAGRIKLRRSDGDLRTDIDAVVFDRKTGTLGVFELKSQDPFARSAAELARQRDNVLYANRQVAGVLDWLKRHGGDEILGRVDGRTAKTFRVQRVFPFVLGRYLAHFGDGPAPDRRAAWGTWPQVLSLLDGQPGGAGDANPLASLFTRLTSDAPLLRQSVDGPVREIALGGERLIVYASYGAYRGGG